MLAVAALAAAASLATPAAAWVNTSVKRRVFLQTAVVRERVEYTAENDGDAAAATFDVAFAPDVAAHIALVRADVNKDLLQVERAADRWGST